MTSSDQNKALVRRFYEEIDKGNISILDELVAEDYLDHNPPPFPSQLSGRERLKLNKSPNMKWTETVRRLDIFVGRTVRAGEGQRSTSPRTT